jgi:hypothetical protein
VINLQINSRLAPPTRLPVDELTSPLRPLNDDAAPFRSGVPPTAIGCALVFRLLKSRLQQRIRPLNKLPREPLNDRGPARTWHCGREQFLGALEIGATCCESVTCKWTSLADFVRRVSRDGDDSGKAVAKTTSVSVLD